MIVSTAKGGVAIGILAGAFEMVSVAAHTKLDFTLLDALLLSVISVSWGALMGLGLALTLGVLVLIMGRKKSLSYGERSAGAAGIVAIFVVGFYVWPVALELESLGAHQRAVITACYPIPLAVVLWLHVRFWNRRDDAGWPLRYSLIQASCAAATIVAVFSSILASSWSSSPDNALSGDPNVLLVSIDTLRRDHVSIYDGEAPRTSTPRIDSVGRTGVVFYDAVTPIPETAPAHATMLTGLHPIQHGLSSNGMRLTTGATTLSRALRNEGYAVGAFVSSYAVDSHTGLDRDFHVYDDDFIPVIRGLSELGFSNIMAKLLMKLGSPEDFDWLLERDGLETNTEAMNWIDRAGDDPWFAMVHYFEPHAPYEAPSATVNHRELLSSPNHIFTVDEANELRRLYGLEAEEADGLVGDLLDFLNERGLTENTLVVVTADHGEQLGEHDIFFHHHGLYEESIRVPLVMSAPFAELTGEVSQQVRLTDLAPTILDILGLEPLPDASGVSLLTWIGAPDAPSMSTTLLGRRTPSLGEGRMLGLRTSEVKYLVDESSGDEMMFNLNEDPYEMVDISSSQPGAVSQARSVVMVDRGALGESQAAESGDMEMLRALGYVE
jgi:arylsulfatase A-like enzyme